MLLFQKYLHLFLTDHMCNKKIFLSFLSYRHHTPVYSAIHRRVEKKFRHQRVIFHGIFLSYSYRIVKITIYLCNNKITYKRQRVFKCALCFLYLIITARRAIKAYARRLTTYTMTNWKHILSLLVFN
jgi:hypothetical protein